MFSFTNFEVIFMWFLWHYLGIYFICNYFKTRYYLKGEKEGHKEIFVNLPGLGDTIRLTSHNTILAPISIVRQPGKFSIVDFFSKYPTIRNIFGSVSYFKKKLSKNLFNWF